MTADETVLRREIVAAMVAMDEKGLNHGTAGNVSARIEGGMLVTPSGVPAHLLTPDSIVRMNFDGDHEGTMRPTSEWRMHGSILAARPDVNAIVHCHSRYATTLACAHRTIPPLHYMTAITGGGEIRLAPYEPFGSEELAHAIVETLDGRLACLMANHGQIAVAPTLDFAMMVATEVEEQAAVYHGTLAIGGAKILSDAQIDDVMQRFAGYGQKKKG